MSLTAFSRIQVSLSQRILTILQKLNTKNEILLDKNKLYTQQIQKKLDESYDQLLENDQQKCVNNTSHKIDCTTKYTSQVVTSNN